MEAKSGAEERSWLLQEDFIRFVLEDLGQSEWVVVYDRFDEHGNRENGGLFSAVLPSRMASKALTKPSTDMTYTHDRPGCFITGGGESEVTRYDRFGQSEGMEPFVIRRWFNDILPAYQELLEEFRLFHNLHHADGSNEYLMLDSDGNEHVAARIVGKRIEVRAHQLRQFLALKDAYLAIYFDRVRNSTLPIEDIEESNRFTDHIDDRTRYTLNVASTEGIRDDYSSFSRVLGKRLIPPFPKERSGMWPYDEEEERFQSFIIGVSEIGDPIENTCDPDLLANNFGANPEAPNYLTPVFFRREVLGKYYAAPSRYEVHDNHLSCGDLWGLRLDNNHPTYVIVFLGDLGSDLSYNEQRYWRSFNVPPDGGISGVTFDRAILAKFADPERPDLLFKYLYDDVIRKWPKEWGWSLLRTLGAEDEHCLKALHVPLTDEQKEFDDQVLNLTKLLVDSLNESELVSRAGTLREDPKGIDKLEGFFREQGFSSMQDHIGFLRDLQSLRSCGVAHLKGDRYKKIKKRFSIGDRPLRECFEEIVNEACRFLKDLCELEASPDGEEEPAG